MKHRILLYGAAVLAIAGLTACVDDGYDLSDIDTTTRLSVTDLVIPVNIDDVTLSDIISTDDGSEIKPVTIGGRTFYAFTKSGSFNSDGIKIDAVKVNAPTLTPTTKTLTQVQAEQSARARAAAFSATYQIVEMGNTFSSRAFNVDKAIVQLDGATTEPVRFTVRFEAMNLNPDEISIDFTDIVIRMPKGLTATTSIGSYDSARGLWTIPSHHVTGTWTDVVLTATAFDFAANGARIDTNREFIFDSEFIVESGTLILTNTVAPTLPPSLEVRADYTMDDIVIKSFDGVVNYTLDGMTIDPISLSDLPEFLDGDETNLRLANPQLYLNLNNPVAGESLRYSAGLSISSLRDNHAPVDFALDGGSFTVGYNHGVQGPYNIAMAPDGSALTVPDGYEANLDYVPFTGLTDLLSVPGATGFGLPRELRVSVVNPEIPVQRVTGFELGRELPGVRGSYEFVAPLDLADNSTIVYTKTFDGWNDDDVDAITITRLEVKAHAVSSVPLDAVVTVYPIDVNGNRMPGVVATSNTLAANSATDFTAVLTGEVRHLDGVVLEARIAAPADGSALAPDQTIKLSDIRATVSGYYEKEL